MATAAWMEQARSASVKDVAVELGLSKIGKGGYGPCPLCEADKRSSTDKRGPIIMETGWKCVACDAKGDVLNMVSFKHFKLALKSCSPEQMTQVQQWFESRKWCEPTPEHERRIPPAELKALWGSTLTLDRAGPDVAKFVAHRGWDMAGMLSLGFARATPDETAWPAWWPSTRARSWRLCVPAFKPDGTMASVHARSIAIDPPSGLPKTLWPKGYSSSGLIMADKAGLSLLKGHGDIDVLIICEGITDLISASLYKARSKRRDPSRIAVLSCANGGFKALGDIKTDGNLKVYVATDEGDADGTGDNYATQVTTAFYGRHPVKRIPLSIQGGA